MSIWQGKTVLMMAGGTGGHVYPALALANEVAKQGATVYWLGNTEGFEGKKVPQAGYVLHDIQVCALRGKGLLGWLKSPLMIWQAFFRAKVVMNEIKPDVVIGMGGFASGPGGLAAKALNIPLVIHEQNAVMGMTNTWLAKFADLILLADKRAASKLSGGKVYLETGNPVRADIVALDEPQVRYNAHQENITLLVLGGSQGAKAMNNLLPRALAELSVEMRPKVIHQVGERWLAQTQRLYEELEVAAKVVPFIEDMAAAYGNADWVIARSGALTVAELATVGLPVLFIPFPHAVDDHQTANAQELVEIGAAKIIQQSDLTVQKLAEEIVIRANRKNLKDKAILARQCSHAGALNKIVTAIEEIIS